MGTIFSQENDDKGGPFSPKFHYDKTHKHRFDIEDGKWLDYLQENGYVVIKDCLGPEQREKAVEMAKDWFTRISKKHNCSKPFDFEDIDSWDSIPCRRTTGIIGSVGAGQTDFCWYIRTQPKVKEVFSKIWNNDDLCVSFDGFNIFRPWQLEGKQDWKTSTNWFHIDQNSLKESGKGLVCVQGLVTMHDVSIETGGLTLIPKSHLLHDELCKMHGTSRGHYVPIHTQEPKLAKLQKTVVTAKAGDLCLWDSRTVHCNSPGEGFPEPRADFMRLISYVCMTPTEFCRNGDDESALQNRLDAWDKHESSTHWPHLYTARPAKNFVERKLFTEPTPEIKALVRGNKPLASE